VIYLHMLVEGDAELNFVKRVLAKHLGKYDVVTDVRKVCTSRNNRAGKVYRGGMSGYSKTKGDISAWLKERSRNDSRFTTMLDLYALPAAFPGSEDGARQNGAYKKVQVLEEALAKDIDDWRFIPYIQLHEFEALIFCDPQQLDWEYIEHEEAAGIRRLVEMVGDQNPELINDGPETAPSKRILRELPGYKKATVGVSVVEKIGLPLLREKCPHFSEWVSRLEQLAAK
jgi:hypothetical protein